MPWSSGRASHEDCKRHVSASATVVSWAWGHEGSALGDLLEDVLRNPVDRHARLPQHTLRYRDLADQSSFGACPEVADLGGARTEPVGGLENERSRRPIEEVTRLSAI